MEMSNRGLGKKLTIEEIKSTEVEILKYIDRICRDNGISYFLEAGTLLGAVRHKGFIPWDDDIDIALMRSDYDRLIDLLKSDDSIYAVSDIYGDSSCILPFAKVYDKRTIVKWKVKYPREPKYGVWIDLFPIDNVPDNKISLRIYQIHMRVLKSLYEHRRNIYVEEATAKKRFAQFISGIHSIDYYLRKIDMLARKYSNINTNNVMNIFGIKDNYQEKKKNFFTELFKTEFENMLLPIPANYNAYLTLMYGDYMTLPPEEDRKVVHVIDAYYKEP